MARHSVATASVLLALAIWCAGTLVSQAPPSADVRFHWGFALLAAGQSEPTPIVGDVVLRQGDRVKMYISPRSASFLYLLMEAPRGEVRLLFPESFAQFSGDYGDANDYYAPTADEWLALDDTRGEHRIHVLASRTRLTRLEALVNESARAEPSRRARLGQSIASEIRTLKAKHRRLHAAQSRPMPMGGAVRGDPAVKAMARVVEAHEFFATTYLVRR